MSTPSRLYFVEETSDNHYTFRYGGNVIEIACRQKQWCLLRNGASIPLEGDNLHEALYQVVRRFQDE